MIYAVFAQSPSNDIEGEEEVFFFFDILLRLSITIMCNFLLLIFQREGQAEILDYLLDCCSNIWDSHSKNGRTPLHTAGV